MKMKAYIRGYNLMDFFAGNFRMGYGKVEEIGSNYVIAKGALSYTGEENWYTNVHSNGWLEFRPLSPIYLKAGTTYTLSYDITLLETIDGKTAFTAAAHNFGKSYIYSLKNTLDKQHVVFRRTFDSDTVLSNTTNTFNISTNSLHVKIENLMFVEGEEEKPYDNGRIRVKPVIPVRNPKNLIPFPYSIESGYKQDGITVEYDKYGTFSLKGTQTATANRAYTVVNKFYLPLGDYTLSIPKTHVKDVETRLRRYKASGAQQENIQVSPNWGAYSINFTVKDETDYYQFGFTIYKGAQIDGTWWAAITKKGEQFDNPIAPQKCNIFIKE